MGNRKKIKASHVSVVLKEFVKYLNAETSLQFEILDLPDPPDAILKSGNTYLWVEHADIYRSGDEAHEEYSYVTPGERLHIHQEHPISEPDKRTAVALINTLERKLAKESYADIFKKYGRGILVLTERDPLFSDSTLESIRRELEDYEFPYDRGYFKEVYIGYRCGSGLAFEKLYENW